MIWRGIRVSDALAVLLAAPVAAALRDPSLFSDGHLGPTMTYCSIGLISGLSMLLVFHVAKSLSDPVSLRELESFALVSMAATALTAVIVFSMNRLDSVPRSMPVIQFLVLLLFLSSGRVVANKWRRLGVKHGDHGSSSHVLIIGANRLAWSYLRMLDTLDVEETNIAAILDDDPKMLGRSLFGYPVVASPAGLEQVVKEYHVHGVNIDRVLVMANRRAKPESFTELEEYCTKSGISFEFFGDSLGIKLDGFSTRALAIEAPVASGRGFPILKRVFDFSLSLALSIILLPLIIAAALGVFISVGWPVIFWQKRVGYEEKPFLVYKFRTLRASFDRRGRFVPEDQRASRVGDFLRRTRFDEVPQLWNVLAGHMSFVGPRPLLPVDQPLSSKLRLTVKPGITGWAQVNGGKRVSAEEKGLLDDWYVNHASFRLDIWIVARTILSVIFGDKENGTLEAKAQGLSHFAEQKDSVSDDGALAADLLRQARKAS
jgi:lipopolysaccharide/colanic/teichoic acid biosynthesis glycosyltransferase